MDGEGDDGRSGAHGEKATQGCPCGYLGDAVDPCRCSPIDVERYRSRISGPLLDRIDIHLEVPAVAFRDLPGGTAEEPSEAIRARVEHARELQRRRFRGQPGLHTNAHMTARELRRHCRLSGPVESLLRDAVNRLGLSARAYHRVLKIGRTIAPGESLDRISARHGAGRTSPGRSASVGRSRPQSGPGCR